MLAEHGTGYLLGMFLLSHFSVDSTLSLLPQPYIYTFYTFFLIK